MTENHDPHAHTAAGVHSLSIWQDEYDEWVWACSCSPDVHGGYTSAQGAKAGYEAAHARDEDPEGGDWS
jgi:hypothetical protein